MTREEAIICLKADLIYDYMTNTVNHKEHDEALKLAIQALSQEPTVTSTDEPMTMVYPTIVCDDAISREAVINIVKLRWDYYKNCIEAIEKLPSVTQKSGKWIDKKYYYECSQCGLRSYLGDSNFCPNCGACMKDGRTLDEFIEDMRGDTE